jgi:hypothetical protein
MARKNRRLSSASVYRYYLKRYTMNIGTAGHVLGKEVAMNPEAMKAIARLSEQETYNWVTDYASSHLAKEIVKNISEKYGIPGTFQGLLMAYAEKVIANYILDYKGETLTEMHQNYLWSLMMRNKSGTIGTTSGYLYTFIGKDRKPRIIDMSKVLTEIEEALLKTLK